ncbi:MULTISPECIES: nucleotidyltransferase family protein [Bacillus]|uniref:nucleotidyltransferase family protein n=1 Tax=Bacillus TaxID=1386 RepID=UPI000BB67C2F|nr:MULTISPECIES: nucleotidyltransferase family protein [Bacillus]
MISNEDDIKKLISLDEWMMSILKTTYRLNLPDWWICAGFVRSKVWDTLHDFPERTPIEDIDVIYFDESNIDEEVDKQIEMHLHSIHPKIPWSVKNEARMHLKNNIPPYSSSVDAISKFPETATAIGVKLDKEHNLVLTTPCGINDLINMIVKPTSFFQTNKEQIHIYNNRLKMKKWHEKWNKVKYDL